MTRFGISVEKTVSFRLVNHPFANVYHYEAAYSPTDTAQLEAMLDRLVVLEKTWHAPAVTFIRGRVWNTGSGSQAGNQMRVDKALSGTGSSPADSGMDRERAFLLRWPAGFNSRGKPVYLRKWYHSCGAPTGVTVGSAQLANTAPLSGASQAAWEALGDDIQTLEVGGIPVGELVAQSGRARTGDTECHPWLEHHQLGDQWRV